MSTDEIELLFEYLSANNSLLVRLIQSIDFFIALVVVIVICFVYYNYLKYFTRF